jgi:hypothetical protein
MINALRSAGAGTSCDVPAAPGTALLVGTAVPHAGGIHGG